jgi:hypothetical protein
MSKYMLILRRNQAEELGLSQAEMFARFKEFTVSLQESGVLVIFERLKAATEGKTVRTRHGTATLEGPFSGSNESVIGFYLIEADDEAAALAIARECPILRVGGSVEIRETEFFPSS